MSWGKPSKRDRYLQSRYGIDEKEYERLLVLQHRVCAVCGRAGKTRRLAVDHNHKTKKVRGLLCPKCNWGIGWFREDTRVLRAAADYLDKYNSS